MARAEALSSVLEQQREALSACAEALSATARTPLEDLRRTPVRCALPSP